MMSLELLARSIAGWPKFALEPLWPISWHAGVVAILVVLLRGLLGRWLSPWQQHALWLIVLIRLLIPAAPPSRMSIFGLLAHPLVRSEAAPLAEPAPLPSQSHPFHITLADSFVPAPPGPQPVAIQRRPSWPQRWQRITRDGRWLGDIWAVGVLLLLARLLWTNLLLARRTRHARLADSRLSTMLARCCQQVGMSRRPVLKITSAVATPAVMGILNPRLLLPAEMVQRLSHRQLRLILLHELLHLKCRDIEIDWLWATLTALHWFNPMLWIIGPMRRFDRERARDQMVMSIARPDAAEAYAGTLLKVATLALPGAVCPGVVGMASGKQELRQRILSATRFSDRRRATRWIGVAVLAAAGCASLTNPRSPSAATQSRSTSTPSAAMETSTAATIRRNDAADKRAADATAQAKLDRQLPDLRFNAEPLSDVIDFLRDTTGANIFVDWPALERAGISRDAPVTARLRDIKFSKALELIFKCVEGNDYDRHLGYRIDWSVITISTRRELDKNVETRRYDINDLLFVPPDDPEINIGDAVNGHSRPQPSSASQASEREERIGEIERYIMDNVAPGTWKARGGETGQIQQSPLRAILLITQTPEYHVEIQAVLNSLRASLGLQISVQTQFLSLSPSELAKLSPALRQRLVAANRPNPKRADTPADRDDLLSAADVSALVRAAGSAMRQPRLTIFSGQRATIAMNTDIPYIGAMAATVQGRGADSTTRYEPIAKTVHEGIETQLLAAISPDHASAMVDLHVILSSLDLLSPEHWPGAPPEAKVFVQRPTVSTAELRTDCSIPDGQCLLVGGFQLGASEDNASSAALATALPIGDPGIANMMAAARHQQLYLLVRPQLLGLNPPQRAFPLLPSPHR